MRALDRKLLRDLRRMWSEALTIALVVACGIGGFITTLSAVDSLAVARDRFYAEARFADLFASVKRAPDALLDSLRRVPGVAELQPSTEQFVRVRIPGLADPIIGQLIGVDRLHGQRLNRVVLRSGRTLAAGARPGGLAADGAIEALVSEAFASAHGLAPGARVTALVNGRLRTLQIVGIALSPEFIFAGLWGTPDQRGFGVFWVDREVLSAAYDMGSAFNRLAVRLAPGAAASAVAAQLAQRLERYGAREVVQRADQTSHAMLDNEIKEQRVIGSVLPAIFLGVAAFLLDVVVSRLVATQREQIAALEALGYASPAIAAHYLELVLGIVVVGLALGLWLGDVLGALLTGLYAEFFRFPRFEHFIAPWLLAASAGIAVAAAVAGTLGAILAALRLSPAEAMRPPAPGRYRRTLLERMGLTRIAPATRMILRNMERRPLRSGLSIIGVAAAVAIVVMGNFFRDAIEFIVDSSFNLAMRNDVAVWMAEPIVDAARHELARLPGVIAVESTRFAPVTLVNGHRRERSQLRGYPARSGLFRVIDVDGRATPMTADGVLLTDRLADKLGLRVGDRVLAEVLEGRPRRIELTVEATVREMMGLNAYMERRALNRALGEGDIATGYLVAVERGAEARLLAATQALPKVAGAFSKATMLRNMQDISARNIRIMSTVLTAFACVIAVGVVYNNARIELAERAWELASLRVLGFSRAEVSALLLGEMALCIVVALPLGMLLGQGLVHLITGLLKSDQFLFPVVIRPRTHAFAALAVLAAGLASAAVVRRRVDRLDMVSALKTRE